MRLPTNSEIQALRPIETYRKVLKTKAKSVKNSADLEELDRWYRQEGRSNFQRVAEDPDQVDKSSLKPEWMKLMRWKMARGSFRPTLLPLLASNDEDSISLRTMKAFSFRNSNSSTSKNFSEGNEEHEARFERCLEELTHLKGVGPATASAAIANLDPENEPFFGDELTEWMWRLEEERYREDNQQEEKSKANKGKGKEKKSEKIKFKIQYNVKWYRELRGKVRAFREDLTSKGMVLDVEEIERIAWTWFNAEKFGISIEELIGDSGENDGPEESATDQAEGETKGEEIQIESQEIDTARKGTKSASKRKGKGDGEETVSSSVGAPSAPDTSARSSKRIKASRK